MPSEIRLTFDSVDPPYWAPGASTSRFATASLADPEMACCAEPRMEDRSSPNLAITITVITAAPVISSTALMICTHVVPRIPPMRT